MDVFSLRINSLLLNDVNRRSLYIAVTLLGRTAWIQWWPRPVANQRFLTVGIR